MKLKLSLIAFFTAAALTSAHAQVLGIYNFNSTVAFPALSPSSVSSTVTLNDLNIEGSTMISAGFFGFTNNELTTYTNSAGSTSLANSRTNGSYFQFTITPTGDQTVNLGSVSFDLRGGNVSARGVGIYTSADNYSTALSPTPTVTSTTYSNYSVDLSSIGGVTSATTVRFYIWSSGATNTLFFDNITVSAIPEPSSFAALLAAASLGFVALRRRRTASV
jgi:hypothetical protein